MNMDGHSSVLECACLKIACYVPNILFLYSAVQIVRM